MSDILPSELIYKYLDDGQDGHVSEINALNDYPLQSAHLNLEQFVGEYTKQIDLTNNAKGIYFLEIETIDGVINKKLILQ